MAEQYGSLCKELPKLMCAGSEIREIWRLRGNDTQTALQVLNPCQSTGLWHVKPTAVGVAFMRAMVHRLFSLPWGWDQSVWQEVGAHNRIKIK